MRELCFLGVWMEVLGKVFDTWNFLRDFIFERLRGFLALAFFCHFRSASQKFSKIHFLAVKSCRRKEITPEARRQICIQVPFSANTFGIYPSPALCAGEGVGGGFPLKFFKDVNPNPIPPRPSFPEGKEGAFVKDCFPTKET